VTIVGDPNNAWNDSANWVITVGYATGTGVLTNQEVGRYDASRKEGMEVKVGRTGTVVGVYRNDTGSTFGLRWIGIFSTATDCSEPFDWSSRPLSTRIPLSGPFPKPISLGTWGKITGGCDVIVSVTNPDDTAVSLPEFSYNQSTKAATITL